MQERPNIYKVTVDNEERKAIDLLVLKEFLERKRYDYNLLDIDISKVEDNVPVVTVIAKAQRDLLIQLETAIDKALGLQEEEPEVQVQPPKEVPKPKEQPKEVPKPEPKQEDTSERIIL